VPPEHPSQSLYAIACPSGETAGSWCEWPLRVVLVTRRTPPVATETLKIDPQSPKLVGRYGHCLTR
jgi:hypothetical protein